MMPADCSPDISPLTALIGSLFFGPDDTSKTFSVPILNDRDADEPTEQFLVGLASQPFDDH